MRFVYKLILGLVITAALFIGGVYFIAGYLFWPTGYRAVLDKVIPEDVEIVRALAGYYDSGPMSFTAWALYELSESAAQEIEAEGLEFFRDIRYTVRPGHQYHFEDWGKDSCSVVTIRLEPERETRRHKRLKPLIDRARQAERSGDAYSTRVDRQICLVVMPRARLVNVWVFD